MDGQRFDQLAKALVTGASRRRVLQGFIGGALAVAAAQRRIPKAQAQCTWSGTFESLFGGGITMTLEEAGGQVTGSYAFPQDNMLVNGTISGIARSDFPGYTVLDGYWREPGEGGRIWFAMPLDACGQFTGQYTTTDLTTDWTPGWDGARVNAAPSGGEAQATFFSNPGDTRAAAITMEGRSGILFGPKDAEGGVEYINYARISSPDGNPQTEVFLDFDAAGSATRARLGSGETMLFSWLSPTSVSITYQSADGSQEVQFPYEVSPTTTSESIPAHPNSDLLLAPEADAGDRLAFTSLTAPALMTGARSAHLAAQSPMGNPGVIEVRCGSGAPVAGATVTGTVVPANVPGTAQEVSFTETFPGVFEYTLPIAPAPQPGEQFHRTRVQRALMIICVGNAAMLLTQASKEYICATLLGIPAAGTVGFAACEVILTTYVWMCRLNFASTVGGMAVDFFANAYEVTALAQHKKLGTKQIKVSASAGVAIPKSVIELSAGAGISEVTTVPPDPGPSQGYEIHVGTVCAPSGSTLTVSVVGSDEFADETSVTISETVTEATLVVPGGAQGVKDVITAELSGTVSDAKTKEIIF